MVKITDDWQISNVQISRFPTSVHHVLLCVCEKMDLRDYILPTGVKWVDLGQFNPAYIHPVSVQSVLIPMVRKIM